MRRLLLPVLLLCCLVVAQNDDTSKEEALLNELLSSPAETAAPEPDASTSSASESLVPVEDASRAIESAPSSETDNTSGEPVPVREQTQATGRAIRETVQPSAIGSSSPDVEDVAVEKPQKSNRRSRGSPPVSSASPELSEVARVQETPDIPNFTHRAHIEDVGAECAQCHQTLFTESVRGYRSGPSMKEICSQCHNGTDAPSELLAGFSNEKKYVKINMPLFSHTSHIQHTENCVTCHTDIYGDLKKIKTPPPMSRCAGCHNDHKANSECRVCHQNVNDLKPKSHTSRWVYRNGHGKESRFGQKECVSCHTERSCNACHRGQTTFDVHRPGYKYSHGMDARQRVSNCGYCHDAEINCAKCHERKQ